jgi:replicative DNA helicase
MREWARRAFEDKPPFIVPSMSGHMDVTPNVVQSYIDIHKPGLVVLDYTQLMMDNAKSKEMTARMMNLTQELKSLAQRNELPVIAISSVKDGDKSDRDSPPGIDQLMASRQIEFNATLAFSVHLHDHGILEINGAKNRNGPKFNFGIRVDADKGVFVEEFDF